jgi:hypothetical protein
LFQCLHVQALKKYFQQVIILVLVKLRCQLKIFESQTDWFLALTSPCRGIRYGSKHAYTNSCRPIKKDCVGYELQLEQAGLHTDHKIKGGRRLVPARE